MPARSADYRRWPDHERWELIEGIAWNISPAPSARHQAIVVTLATLMRASTAGRACAVFVAL